MDDPCKDLREQAAMALQELTQASEAMAQFSVVEPYQTDTDPDEMADYLKRMQESFERERIAWEAYYRINVELLECMRDIYSEQTSQASS